MSARNFLSAREKNINRDCLPYIGQQKFIGRSELPVLSANAYNNLNRNLVYYNHHFPVNSYERSGTPYSDFLSDSETGTPDFCSEESDSSAGSVLKRNTAEATRVLADEWERIERTLYDEEGEKSKRPDIIEECKQWQELHTQLRILGRGLILPEKRLSYRQIQHEEVIAMHYSDYEEFSEGEERPSESSTDVTPTNTPRSSSCYVPEVKLSREKISYQYTDDLADTFSSLLKIRPIQIQSPSHRKRQNQSIIKSEIASSKWMKNPSISPINFGRNSAKSYLSVDQTKLNSDNGYSRVYTARFRESLHPLYSPDTQIGIPRSGLQHSYNIRKVSLPPLLRDDEKKKAGSAKKQKPRKVAKNSLERVKHTQ